MELNHFYGLGGSLPREKKFVRMIIAHEADTMKVTLSGLNHPSCCRRYILDSIPFIPGTFNIDCVPILVERYGDCGAILPGGDFELDVRKCGMKSPRYLNITPEIWPGD